MNELPPNVLPYLREQFAKARPILFTGAGFSMAANSLEGGRVATVGDVKERLWSITFPDDLFDDSSTLQDIYESALMRQRNKIAGALTPILSVKDDSIPEWYRLYFSFPWSKCYTLNIDDLELAAERRSLCTRKINSVSGIQESTLNQRDEAEYLNVIHLNGSLQNLPHGVTFSTTQYAERLANSEPVYVRLVGELVSQPFVFVGTKLDESPLWQHLELRAQRGGKVRELRKKSFLITPSLDKARQVALTQFNIEWLPMTAEDFAVKVLSKISDGAEEGNAYLAKSAKRTPAEQQLLEVGNIAIDPYAKSDFLVGEEPAWSDIQKGHAIERSVDRRLWALIRERLSADRPRGMICVTGTSGCGKSTSLMRAALRLASDGVKVGWVNSATELSAREVVRASETQGLNVVAIDDADFLGGELNGVVRSIVSHSDALILTAMRTIRRDRILNPAVLENIPLRDCYLEDLTDSDINELLDVLEKENRLGGYKGMSRDSQREQFRQDTGRQLLVGMIKATSGERLEDKVPHEFEQLDDLSKIVYGAVCVANYLGGFVNKQDLLIVSGAATNETLNKIEALKLSRLIGFKEGSADDLRARHKLIAELVFKHLQTHGGLFPLLTGLAVSTASKIRADMPNRAKPRRFLARIISHDFLHQILGPEMARNLYSSLEPSLRSDSHYWLQRGCLELEFDNLRLAENFLMQARSLDGANNYILTGYAHLLFKKAIHQPNAPEALTWVSEAETMLEGIIKSSRVHSSRPFHIYCSQGLAWSRRGLSGFEQKRDYLSKLRVLISDGIATNPQEDALRNVQKAIDDDYLSLAVR